MTTADAELTERFAAYDRWLEMLRAVAEEMRQSWPELAPVPVGDAVPAQSADQDATLRSVN